MNRYTFLFLIILNINTVFAQKAELTIIDLKPIIENNKFPEVHFKNNISIEEKINTSLQLEYLEHLPNVFKKNPFEKVSYDEKNCCSYVQFYEWKKNNSPKNILSITINGEASTAYPEAFERYHNFDLRTGNQIVISNVFTKKGLQEIARIQNLKVKTRIQNYLSEIKVSIKKNNLPADEKERMEEQIGMYEDCLLYVDNSNLDYEEYYFEKDSILFVRGRCSNHAMRAIDDLDDFKNGFSYKEIEKHLSVYGANLINGSRKNEITLNPAKKFYKGKINNKYPITATIIEINSDNSIQILYWYDTVKTPIEWWGKFENNHFSLTENIDDEGLQNSTPKAKIEAELKNNTIIGTWKNCKTQEILKLELQEY